MNRPNGKIALATLAALFVFHAAGAFAGADAIFLANAFANASGTIIVGLIFLAIFGCFCSYIAVTCGLMLIKSAPAKPVGMIVMGYLGCATMVFLVVGLINDIPSLDVWRGVCAGAASLIGAWLVIKEKERQAARRSESRS